MATTVVSCPGKVLLAGGYLVLEPEHPGLVVGTASRFYTVIQGKKRNEERAKRYITVRSSQFKDATWNYQVAYINEHAMLFVQSEDGASTNKFVQLALEAALKVSCAMGNFVEDDLDIAIVGDNDFYSQDRTASTSSSASEAAEPEPFVYLNTTLGDVHKTGLGSSAAMVTSLVAAIFIHSSPSSSSSSFSELPEDTLKLIHNTAQYAHSQAQGKVGSGFDVSAAIWGSQIYRRFNPQCLASLLETNTISPSQLLEGLSPSSELWKPSSSTSGEVSSFSLPPCTTLLLADVDAGSNTPSMVGKVLKWRKSAGEEGDRLWASIADANRALADVFEKLQYASQANSQEYKKAVADLAKQPSPNWSSAGSDTPSGLFCLARDSIKTVRSRIKRMGELADVPIEPDEQTRLLDACTEGVNGVIGGGVPGAGGYDAIWVLVLSPEQSADTPSQSEEAIRDLWLGWTEMSVRPLSRKARIQQGDISSAASSGSKTVMEQGKGLKLHRLEEVEGLAKAVER